MKTLKWLAICFLLACVTSVAINGSLADRDADNNYLTIVQLKLERSANGLCEAVNNRDLLPIAEEVPTKETVTASQEFTLTDKDNNTTSFTFAFEEEMYTSENALDYIVAVRNCGNVTGYIRTWFAFEMGNLTNEEFDAALLFNMNTDEWTWSEFEYGIIINGERYAVVCAEHKDGVGAGAVTAPSLLQILLRNGVDNDIVKRIDGNYDFNYNVIAYSKAVSDSDAWSSAGQPWIAGQNNIYPPQQAGGDERV